MGEYMGKFSLDNATPVPVGSTLFGVCNTQRNTAAKEIPITDTQLGNNFNILLDGVTVHIQFKYGNGVAAGQQGNLLTLKIGSTDAKPITNPGGSCIWAADAVISFTFDGTNWVANDGMSTTVNVQQNYLSTDTDPISGAGVAQALGTLDVSNITGFGANKTLATLTETDGKIAATFQDVEVDWDNVNDKPTLGDAAEKGVITSIIENGANMNKNSTDLPTTNAVSQYIDSKISGLTGVMHFVGSTTTALVDGTTVATVIINSAQYTPAPGDVVLSGDNKEFVWTGTLWELLGDEGSYALKTNTASVIKTAALTGGSLPTLTVTQVNIPNVTDAGTAASLTTKDTDVPNVTSAGTVTTAEVRNGVLHITTGTATQLGTAITIKEVNQWTAGTAPTLGTAIPVGSASGWDDGAFPTLDTSNETVVKP